MHLFLVSFDRMNQDKQTFVLFKVCHSFSVQFLPFNLYPKNTPPHAENTWWQCTKELKKQSIVKNMSFNLLLHWTKSFYITWQILRSVNTYKTRHGQCCRPHPNNHFHAFINALGAAYRTKFLNRFYYYLRTWCKYF